MNPYLDSESGTPLNKLGIKDRDTFFDVEYRLTDLRIAQWLSQPNERAYDYDHLKKVHEHIFQDVYAWAGKERTLNFSKRDLVELAWTTPFADVSKIPEIAKSVEDDLRQSRYLRGLEKKEFTDRLTNIYIKLNCMHPFPEGNGRATQTFLTQLSRDAGYDLDFSRVSSSEWNHAAARSMPQRNIKEPALWRPPNNQPIRNAFEQVVTGPERVKNKPEDRTR